MEIRRKSVNRSAECEGGVHAGDQPRIGLRRASNQALEFSFHAATGLVHVIEYAEQLSSSTHWQPLPSFDPVTGDGELFTHQDDPFLLSAASKRFFRLRSEWAVIDLPDPLVLFEFTDNSSLPQQQDPEVAASAFAISAGTLGFGTAAPDVWEAGSGIPYAQGFTGWGNSQPEGAKHFHFTVSVASNRFLSISNLSFHARATDLGPSAISVSVNGDLYPPQNIEASDTTFFTFPLTGHNQITQAVVRIKGWDNDSRTTTGGGGFYIDDVAVLGEVTERPPDFVSVPLVEAGLASARSESSATLAATVIDTGGAPIFERGFFWSTEPGFDPLEEGLFVQEFGEFGGGRFSLTLIDLPEGATIYYRAYAVNSEGLALSSQRQFNTLAGHELVYYGFTGYTRMAEAHRRSIIPESVQISSGSTSYGFVNPNDWIAAGASEPYLDAQGTWHRTSQNTARSFDLDLTADNGWLITVTGITFLARATGAGPSAIGVSAAGVSMHAQDMPANQVITVHAAITNIHQESSVQINIQGWDNLSRSTSGSGHLRIDNILLTGSMAMIMTTAPPTVVSPTASGVVDDRAWLGGDIIDNGGSSVIERGIYWSTNPDFIVPNGGFPVPDSLSEMGAFAVHAYQLPPGTTVYYRAYARTVAGKGTTEVASFATPDLPADLLANYTFSGSKVVPHQRHPDIIASHIARRNGRPGIVSGDPSEWTGSGVPVGQISGGFQPNHPLDGNYAIFAIEARQGTTFTITNLTFLARATNNGPAAVSIVLDNVVHGSRSLPANETREISVVITGVTDRELATLRIGGWNDGSRSTTGTGTLQFDDIVLQGTVNGTPFVPHTSGRPVRVASVNVKDGISEPGDADHDALRAILFRMNADVVAFQELYSTETSVIDAMATDLGYPYWEIAPNTGISGAQRVGFFSRYPFTAAAVDSPPAANEFTRAILRAVIDVPDAEHPLVVWAVHKKAINDSVSQFRRAVETYRILEDIAAYHAAHPEHDEYVILGDFNADFYTQEQEASFSQSWYEQIQHALPASYVLGDDHVWPILYARFPDDRYASASLPIRRVQMTQSGGFGIYSFRNASFISRLDYIYASEALMARNPEGEIYYSLMDGPHPGLPKAGDPVMASASWLSSDHLPVFADFHMSAATSQDNVSAWSSNPGQDQQVAEVSLKSTDQPSVLPDTQSFVDTSLGAQSIEQPANLTQSHEQPRLYVWRNSDGHLLIGFSSQANHAYTIEATLLDAGHADWIPMDGAIGIPGTGGWIELPVDNTDSQRRVYRLRAAPIEP